jgi:hypothetical protein
VIRPGVDNSLKQCNTSGKGGRGKGGKGGQPDSPPFPKSAGSSVLPQLAMLLESLALGNFLTARDRHERITENRYASLDRKLGE